MIHVHTQRLNHMSVEIPQHSSTINGMESEVSLAQLLAVLGMTGVAAKLIIRQNIPGYVFTKRTTKENLIRGIFWL